jgi:hypothetical protein
LPNSFASTFVVHTCSQLFLVCLHFKTTLKFSTLNMPSTLMSIFCQNF